RVPRTRWFDRRFRRAASIGWFSPGVARPGITIERATTGPASIRTRGAVDLDVPWLPCASAERVAACRVRASRDPSCRTVGLAGTDERIAGIEIGYPTVRVTPQMLLGEGDGAEVACVVHCGLTDDAAFGSVVLAQAGVPSIALASAELRAIFAGDTAAVVERAELCDAVARLVNDAGLRERYGSLVAADSRRRFSPRRSAIRVVDMLCAARFGLERPATARSNSPL
ncbi:MAG: hypothetical protein WAK16_08220, partial [Candidatus Cybelea sp.]